jgi:uncharacterized protein (TIGR02246 family)
MTTSSDVIDRQVAAYNRPDIQGFVACYAPDAKVVQPDGSTLASGRDQIGSVYGGLFENSPSLHAEIRKRAPADRSGLAPTMEIEDDSNREGDA